jgi:hypothetical protein
MGTKKKDWILFKQFLLRSKGSGQIQYQAPSAIGHLILFEPSLRGKRKLSTFFRSVEKIFHDRVRMSSYHNVFDESL